MNFILVVFALVCVPVLVHPIDSFGAPEPPAGMYKMAEEGENMKSEADEAGMSEEQFYRCFADINCKLGPEVFQQVKYCYTLLSPEEVIEYAGWFQDCPVGNFDTPTLEAVNTEFCTLDYPAQRKVNDCFADHCMEKLTELCKQPENKKRCNRLKKAAVRYRSDGPVTENHKKLNH
ncbi:uncharacterized protein LOC129228640 [Uloborus diversus]|uniref:uncharacterized protein LOC129228640 n=1 Tax=Uloborus diversus TaxID=327109 RepID=UPI002409D6FD|nr:uncharacterized protein LOC129228640 [Uloborus diversus]